jgi:benzaldehyde dehydrogenase (NAD)
MSLLETSLWEGKIYVNGWREGGSGAADSIEPATGEVLGRYGMASVEDVKEAAAAAASAQKEWAARKPEERAAVLRRAGQLWEEHAEEIQSWLVRESGGIGPKAGLEPRRCRRCRPATCSPPTRIAGPSPAAARSASSP